MNREISQPDTLLIFDYSGTLSLEAPRFARPDNLQQALTESGLSSLGVTGPEIFWEGIVKPTWVEGSTTQTGYARVMAERITALQLAPAASPREVAAAASRFVKRYLDRSRIEADWRPLLARLSENPDAGVIIATDHYAEATEMIVDALGAWGIPAVKTGAVGKGASCRSNRRPFLVANSADLGSWKADVAFWESLTAQLRRDRVKRLLIVDDFGFNEAAGDGYGGEMAKIVGRKEQTRATLRTVFRVEAEIIPFFLDEKQRERAEERAHLIAETALHIDRFLERH